MKWVLEYKCNLKKNGREKVKSVTSLRSSTPLTFSQPFGKLHFTSLTLNKKITKNKIAKIKRFHCIFSK